MYIVFFCFESKFFKFERSIKNYAGKQDKQQSCEECNIFIPIEIGIYASYSIWREV